MLDIFTKYLTTKKFTLKRREFWRIITIIQSRTLEKNVHAVVFVVSASMSDETRGECAQVEPRGL